MKVQTDAVGVRYADIKIGNNFTYLNDAYIKTGTVNDNMFYSVNLATGIAVLFYDYTVVTPVKLMVVPEE